MYYQIVFWTCIFPISSVFYVLKNVDGILQIILLTITAMSLVTQTLVYVAVAQMCNIWFTGMIFIRLLP